MVCFAAVACGAAHGPSRSRAYLKQVLGRGMSFKRHQCRFDIRRVVPAPCSSFDMGGREASPARLMVSGSGRPTAAETVAALKASMASSGSPLAPDRMSGWASGDAAARRRQSGAGSQGAQGAGAGSSPQYDDEDGVGDVLGELGCCLDGVRSSQPEEMPCVTPWLAAAAALGFLPRMWHMVRQPPMLMS